MLLIYKDVQFKWSRECDEAIKLLSVSLIGGRLDHYYSEKIICLATDASPVGGSVFSHVIDGEEVPISFGLEL